MLAADGCGVGVSRCGTHLLGGARRARPGVPAGRPGVDQQSKYTRDRTINELVHPARAGTGSSANETGWRCHSASAHSEQTTRGNRPAATRRPSRIPGQPHLHADVDESRWRSSWHKRYVGDVLRDEALHDHAVLEPHRLEEVGGPPTPHRPRLRHATHPGTMRRPSRNNRDPFARGSIAQWTVVG